MAAPIVGAAATILSTLFSGPAADAAKAVAKAIDESSMTEAEKIQAAHTAHKEINDNQHAMNLAALKTGSRFIAGWRPFIGWVCGICLAYSYAGTFLFSTFVATCMIVWPERVEELKAAGQYYHDSTAWLLNHVEELVWAMLGVSGLRTTEKIIGVARDNVRQVQLEDSLLKKLLKKVGL